MIRTSLLIAALALGSATSDAVAEPVMLRDAQLDRVTAGAVEVINDPGFFRFVASEDGRTTSVLVRGHEARLDYDIIEGPSGVSGVVVSSAGTPVSGEATDVEAAIAALVAALIGD